MSAIVAQAGKGKGCELEWAFLVNLQFCAILTLNTIALVNSLRERKTAWHCFRNFHSNSLRTLN